MFLSKDLIPGPTKDTLPNDFKYYELSLSVRAAALTASLQREVHKNGEEPSFKEEVAKEAYSHILRSAVLAREAGRFQVNVPFDHWYII